MKSLIPLVLFFYICTFSYPATSQAAVGAPALVGAAAVGVAMASTAAGDYYAKIGEVPQYVSATANGAASIADALFQPSYIAQAVGYLFTPQSLQTAQNYYVAKAASIGAGLSDIIDFVKTTSDGQYTSLKNLLSTNSSSTWPTTSTIPVGTIFKTTSGNYIISELLGTYWGFQSTFESSVVGTYEITKNALYIDIPNKRLMISYGPVPGYPQYALLGSANLQATTSPSNYNTPPPVYNFDSIKDSISSSNITSGLADDIRDSIAALPDDKKIFAESPPASLAAPTTAPTLTPAQVAQALADNAAAVARAVAEATKAIADANPTDAAVQIAALQAAATAAQSSANANASPTTDETPEDYTASAPSLTIPQLHAVTFQPIIDARNLTMTKAPFTWFSILPGILDDLVASPSAPNFTIDLGLLQQEIDLAFLDPFASTCRSIVAFFMYLMTVFLMIKIFRSM